MGGFSGGFVSSGGASRVLAWANIDGDGNLETGSFGIASVVKEFTSDYNITWEAGLFTLPPVVLVTPSEELPCLAFLSAPDASLMTVGIVDVNGDPTASAFSVIAISQD